VVVAWAGEFLGLFETLGFADCALEGFFGGLDLVISHAGCVLGDEVSSRGFRDGRADSFRNSFRDLISADSGIVSNKCG
jgi:hypothetical protein